MDSSRDTVERQAVPPGYTLCKNDDGSTFAVPQFLVPAAHSSFDAFQVKNSLENEFMTEVCLTLCSSKIFNLLIILNAFLLINFGRVFQ